MTVEMWLFVILATIMVVAGVVWLLRVMPAANVGIVVKAIVGVSWLSGFSILVLVPVDLVNAMLVGNSHSSPFLAAAWLSTYWYNFAAVIIILPICSEYTLAGDFSALGRVGTAIQKNLKLYLALGAAGGVGIILLLVFRKLDVSSVVGLAMAIMNAGGLLLEIFLVGFGLVDIPKRLWKAANVRLQLSRAAHDLAVREEKIGTAFEELSRTLSIVREIRVLMPRNETKLNEYLQIVEASAVMESSGKIYRGPPPQSVSEMFEGEDDVDWFSLYGETVKGLSYLRRRVRSAIDVYKREMAHYRQICLRAFFYEDIKRNMDNNTGEFISSAESVSSGRTRLEWVWKCRVRGIAFRLGAIAVLALSCAVFLAEMTIATNSSKASIVAVIAKAPAPPFIRELLVLSLILYVAACAYYTLFRLSVFEFNILLPGHSQGFSLSTNALLICRMSAPIAFNFINIAHVQDTVFDYEIGKTLDATPLLGKAFNTFVPYVLIPYILLILAGFFNVVSRFVMRSPRFVFTDDGMATGRTTDGDPILTRGMEILRLERESASCGKVLGLVVDIAAREGTTTAMDNDNQLVDGRLSSSRSSGSRSAPNSARSMGFKEKAQQAREAAAKVGARRAETWSGGSSSATKTKKKRFSFFKGGDDEEHVGLLG